MVAPAQTTNPITLENGAGVLCAATKSAFNPFPKSPGDLGQPSRRQPGPVSIRVL